MEFLAKALELFEMSYKVALRCLQIIWKINRLDQNVLFQLGFLHAHLL